MDNATLDVSSHQERKDFKHTQIQGMPDFLLHENKKENVEEQFIEPYEDCVVVEELSGVWGKGAQEAIIGAAMRGTPEYLFDIWCKQGIQCTKFKQTDLQVILFSNL